MFHRSLTHTNQKPTHTGVLLENNTKCCQLTMYSCFLSVASPNLALNKYTHKSVCRLGVHTHVHTNIYLYMLYMYKYIYNHIHIHTCSIYFRQIDRQIIHINALFIDSPIENKCKYCTSFFTRNNIIFYNLSAVTYRSIGFTGVGPRQTLAVELDIILHCALTSAHGDTRRRLICRHVTLYMDDSFVYICQIHFTAFRVCFFPSLCLFKHESDSLSNVLCPRL